MVICGLTDDRGDGRQTDLLRRPPAALPHHQLVAWRCAGGDGHGPHHDRLHEAEFLDRVDQFGQRLVVEDLPRLAWVRFDGRRIDLPVDRADTVEVREWRPTEDDIGGGGAHPRAHRPHSPFDGPGRNQRRKAAAEAPLPA